MHLDDRHNKAGDITEFAHVHREVLELVLLGLFEHQPRAVAHCIDASQVPGRVKGWVRSAWERDIWEAGGPRAVRGGGARGAQRAIGRVGLTAAWRDGGLGALAVEQTHGGQVRSGRKREGKEAVLAALQLWEIEIWKTGTVCRGRAKAIHSSSEQNEPRISWCMWCGGPLSYLSVMGCRAAAGGTWEEETGTDCGSSDGVDYARSPLADALATGLTDAAGHGAAAERCARQRV